MKKIILITALMGVTSAIGFAGFANSYFGAHFIAPSEAEKKWGDLALNAEQFKKGDLSKRAPMAVNIVK